MKEGQEGKGQGADRRRPPRARLRHALEALNRWRHRPRARIQGWLRPPHDKKRTKNHRDEEEKVTGDEKEKEQDRKEGNETGARTPIVCTRLLLQRVPLDGQHLLEKRLATLREETCSVGWGVNGCGKVRWAEKKREKKSDERDMEGRRRGKEKPLLREDSTICATRAQSTASPPSPPPLVPPPAPKAPEEPIICCIIMAARNPPPPPPPPGGPGLARRCRSSCWICWRS